MLSKVHLEIGQINQSVDASLLQGHYSTRLITQIQPLGLMNNGLTITQLI